MLLCYFSLKLYNVILRSGHLFPFALSVKIFSIFTQQAYLIRVVHLFSVHRQSHMFYRRMTISELHKHSQCFE